MERTEAPAHVARTVWLLCFAVVLLDGFDLVIYGTVLPSLLADESWKMTPETGGAIGSYALVGLTLGALMSGYIADRFGRRQPLIFYTAMFSTLTALCAVATGPAMLGVLRFLVRLALGGALPMVIALVVEYAPRDRRNFYNASMLTGYAIGAVGVSLVSLVVVPALGFRAMFVFGGCLGLLLVPVLVWWLPESIDNLLVRGRTVQARDLAASWGLDAADFERHDAAVGTSGRSDKWAPVRVVSAPGYRLASIAFPLAGFCSFVLAYGLNTWLPEILRQFGYGLDSALAFLVVLNAGSLCGNLVLSKVADLIGPRFTVVLACAIASVCIGALSFQPPAVLVYFLVFAAGFGALTSGALIFGYVSTYYPTSSRATALGWATGVSRSGGIAGPLISGVLLGATIGPEWNFYVFAATALVCCAIIAVVPRRASAPASASPADAVSNA